MIATNIWFWVGFVAFILAMLSLDLGVFHKKVHEVGPREAAVWTAIWVALALLFAAGLGLAFGAHHALRFLTGYIIEESLSADNIFVMVLIFDYFMVPKVCHHRVLFYGILGALVMRGLFIGLGTLLLAKFGWVTYIFGAMLVVTGARMVFKRHERFDPEQNSLVRILRRYLPTSGSFRGKRFFVVEMGRWVATPLLLVLVLVEFTDLVFAVDSIPAVFGVTRDPFIIYTSNIFAVLGLRSLYFLLASAVERFHLLNYGLAIILTFVGVKMLGEPWIHIETLWSLGVILTVLAVSIWASLRWPPERPPVIETTGSIFGRRPRNR